MKKTMACIFVLMFFVIIAKAQYVNIPDSNFRAFLMNKYPNCFNSTAMMDTTCSTIVNETIINVNNKNINSLDGLKYLKKVKYLYCNNNQLVQLPQLPQNILILDCGYNPIFSLPSLPSTLVQLNILNTNINCLPVLPNSLMRLIIDTANKIHCIPNFVKGLVTSIGQTQGFIQAVSLPICNKANNVNQCHSFPQIQANIFVDNNSNGVKDSNELYKQNVKTQLLINNLAYTNSNGQFEINIDSLGAYTLTIIPPSFYRAIPSSLNFDFNNYDTLINLPDIALQPNILKDSLSITATPMNFAARPGFSYAYKIQYENVGTTVLAPSINFIYDNNLLEYDSSSNNVVTSNGNSLNLIVSSLLPAQAGSFVAYFKVKKTATLGSDLFSFASINAGNCNNADSVISVVSGSYDPNDKHATPTLTVQDVINNKYINYTIRFQNTGTDTAFNVIIIDSLSDYLKANLQGITSSHPCKTTLKNGVIYFELKGINLPDSNTNKSGCNGFVKYQALADESSVFAGTVIPNKAYIYFDYNKAIITNIATTTIQNPLPLTLVTFGAILKSINEISVYWATSNEINAKYFLIEVSADGSNFKPAAEVAAIGDGSNNYSYSIHKTASIYIRLKIVDKDGKFAFSKVIKISDRETSSIIISPNPVKEILNITLESNSLNNTKADLINAQGVIVKSFKLHQGLQRINVANLPAGLYCVITVDGLKKVLINNN